MGERIRPTDGIEELLFALYQELRNILGNIKYVNKELPTLGISQELRDRVGKVFDRLAAGVTLTKEEVECLEGALGNSADLPESAVLLSNLREAQFPPCRIRRRHTECCHALQTVHRST
jgi:hypothetical protein